MVRMRLADKDTAAAIQGHKVKRKLMETTPQLQFLSSSSTSLSLSNSPSNEHEHGNGHEQHGHGQHEITEHSSQQSSSRLNNAGALLEQYTYDDDQTTDLLYAIRNWNLEQRPSSDSCDVHSGGGGIINNGSGGGGGIGGAGNSGRDGHKFGGSGQHQQSQQVEACCNSTIATNSYSHGQTNTSLSCGWTNEHEQNMNHHASTSASMSASASGSKHSQSHSHSHSHSHSQSLSQQSKGMLSSSTPKTPNLCNYSSRPSALTAMILERTASRDSSANGGGGGGFGRDYNGSVLESPTEVDEDAFDFEQHDDEHGHGHENTNGNGSANVTKTMRPQVEKGTRIGTMGMKTNSNMFASPPPHPPSYVMTRENTNTNRSSSLSATTKMQRSKREEEQKQEEEYEAMKILTQTAELLGLNHGPNNNKVANLHAVLPTVQKLVKVITQHVPRLEQFVEQVCEIAEDVELEAEHECDADVEQKKKKKKRKKKRSSRKNMEARKERMDHAVDVLKREWKNKNSSMDDDARGRRGKGEQTAKGINLESETKAEAATLFREAVKNKFASQSSQIRSQYHRSPLSEKCPLQQDPMSDFTNVMTPTFSNKKKKGYETIDVNVKTPTSSTQATSNSYCTWTDDEALKELDRLMQLQEKYNTLEQLAYLQVMVEQPTSSSKSPHGTTQSWQSPTHILTNTLPPSPDHDTVIAELLNANTTTLRKFVLHFAYLFHVKQEEVVNKMNALYVFSQEANELISQVQDALGLSPGCPIHYVAREVLGQLDTHEREGFIDGEGVRHVGMAM